MVPCLIASISVDKAVCSCCDNAMKIDKFRGYIMMCGVALTMVALGATPSHAVTNLVQDGSFETPSFSNSQGYDTFTAGQTFGDWTVTKGSVDLIDGYWKSEDGKQSVDMTGFSEGAIAQSIATTVGVTYDLSFWYAGNPNNPAYNEAREMTVNLGGPGGKGVLISFDPQTMHSTTQNMMWQLYSTTFIAPTASTLLQFTSLTPGFQGIALDNVSISAALGSLSPAPEMSTMLGFGVPLLALGLVSLRRRKTSPQ